MPEVSPAVQPVVVVGGGWAGLSAATTLCARKVPVLLLESARHLGGRARSVRIGNFTADNGQHLMIGGYQSMLDLMQTVGVNPGEVFERLPLTLQLYRKNAISLKLRAPRLPAPFNLLFALLGAGGLTVAEKFGAARFVRRLPMLGTKPGEDICVQALLHSEAQSPGVIRKLWEPLCVAALNTPIELASARLFITVLRTTLTGPAYCSDLLIPGRPLGDLLPRPCTTYLERNGSHLELGQRVTALDVDGQSIRGVYSGERKIESMQVILATPHVITRRLLSRHRAVEKLANDLAALGHEPISTLYLQYPPDTRLPAPMVGLDGALAQWVFDRRVCCQPGLMAVVISARGEHADLTSDDLTARVTKELADCFPHWPLHQDAQLVREKRATFCARAGIDAFRPDNRTPVRGLWLAGDYTSTGLPATLESAVRSGQRCARLVVQALAERNR